MGLDDLSEIGKMNLLCPCGSGKQVKFCCLSSWRGKNVTQRNINPPLPHTGFQNPSCYLSSTQDCCKTISGEHYISSGLLEDIDTIIAVEGFPWLNPGEKRKIPVPKLTANVLCERHNNALSPLDSVAIRFFRTIKRFSKSSYNGEERVTAFNGIDIERWMLKALYGLLASKSLQISPGVKLKAGVTSRCADLLYGKVSFSNGRGLFMRAETTHTIETINSLSASPVTNNIKKTINGIRFNMVGFDFFLSTSPVKAEDAIFQPGGIMFHSHTGLKLIKINWTTSGQHDPVLFNSAEDFDKI